MHSNNNKKNKHFKSIVPHTLLQVKGFKTMYVLFWTSSLFVGIITSVRKATIYSVIYHYVVIRHTRLSAVGNRAFQVAESRLWNSLPPNVPSTATLFFGTASFPDHFLPNLFRFLVLYTVYSSGLAVLYLGHSK